MNKIAHYYITKLVAYTFSYAHLSVQHTLKITKTDQKASSFFSVSGAKLKRTYFGLFLIESLFRNGCKVQFNSTGNVVEQRKMEDFEDALVESRSESI